MISFIKSQRDTQGRMVVLWQKGDYHYEVEVGKHCTQIYLPVEEALDFFDEIVSASPITNVKETA